MTFTEGYKASLLKALDTIDLEKAEEAIRWFERARDEGRQIFVFGNGGSAATASHFATDMVKGASFGKSRRFRIMALTDSLPTVSAYANDVAYDYVFVEQLKNFAAPGDLALGISGSGNSLNVIRAIEYANEMGCRTIGFTGRNGGKLGEIVQLNVQVSEPHMGRIEDGHHILCHMVAYRFMDLD